MSNPWNTETPWSVDNIWTVSKPVTQSMAFKVTGHPDKGWQQYICETHLAPALVGYAGKVSKRPEDYRCLILGSTELEVEKSLWAFGFVGEILSSDIAEKAMARCRDQAKALGKLNASFVVADLNTDRFDGAFDFIIANGILHHIVEQGPCLDMLNSALAPGGILIASEFTGPYRFQLPQVQVDWINSILRLAPEDLRMPGTLDRAPRTMTIFSSEWSPPQRDGDFGS
jgi:SAM-dependent methyltransferase